MTSQSPLRQGPSLQFPVVTTPHFFDIRERINCKDIFVVTLRENPKCPKVSLYPPSWIAPEVKTGNLIGYHIFLWKTVIPSPSESCDPRAPGTEMSSRTEMYGPVWSEPAPEEALWRKSPELLRFAPTWKTPTAGVEESLPSLSSCAHATFPPADMCCWLPGLYQLLWTYMVPGVPSGFHRIMGQISIFSSFTSAFQIHPLLSTSPSFLNQHTI